MQCNNEKTRDKRGASMVVLVAVIAIFVILPIGLLGFELSRAFVIQQQLRSVTDAAALGGTAAMASSPSTDASGNPIPYSQREDNGMDIAIVTFRQNSILDNQFNTANVGYVKNPNPPTPVAPVYHSAWLNILLLDQSGVQLTAAQFTNNTPAATMAVQAYYTDRPIFLSAWGMSPIGNFTVSATSSGGLPVIDLGLCFDLSGSMDDNTQMFLINRFYEASNDRMRYNLVSTPSAAPNDNIFQIFDPPYTGTIFNIAPPQNLRAAGAASTSGHNGNTYVYPWPQPAASPFATPVLWPAGIGLRANSSQPTVPPASPVCPEAGLPPGNFDPASPGSNANGINPLGMTNAWTHVVIDMGTYPATWNGFTFNDKATEVEASVGGLESPGALSAATGGKQAYDELGTLINFSSPGPGYYAAYWDYVQKHASPISEARSACANFFKTMNVSANSHFAFETFADTAGASAGGSFTGASQNIDKFYALGGIGTFPLPLIKLDQSNDNFTACIDALLGNGTTIKPVTPLTQTDIYDAYNELHTELTNTALFRASAKKAIIIFTDGVPNVPAGPPPASPSDTSPPAIAQCLTLASQCNTDRIPTYTIGLSGNVIIGPYEDRLLSDNVNSIAGTPQQGIAFLAGNKGLYIGIASPADLNKAFQTIARSLCTIQ